MKNMESKGLRLLARQDELTEQDWFELLEARRELIAPHLRDMTLKALGDLKIVEQDQRGGTWRRELRQGGLLERAHPDPQQGIHYEPEALNHPQLGIRGIFPDDDLYYHGHFNWRYTVGGMETRFWGLTRSDEWITIKCIESHFHQHMRNGLSDRTEKKTRVNELIVAEATPEEICESQNITPRWLWERLGTVVDAFVEHRTRALGKARELKLALDQENIMVKIVTASAR
jgi:hypothetical protein